VKKGNKEVLKTPLFSSSATGPYLKYHCNDCDTNVVASAEDKFCPFCYSEITDEGKILKAEFSASVEGQKPKFKCSTCEKEIFSTIEKDDEEVLNTCYCPACGSAEVEKLESVEEEVTKAGEKLTDVEDEEQIKEAEDEVDGCNVVRSEDGEAQELEAALISSPEPTWYFFKQGKPILKITKSKVHTDAHPIFATKDFVDIFKTRISELSLSAAIKEFNAEVIKEEEVINSLDLESLAFDKLQAQVIPKFQDCLALAIEGSAKGVYPSLNKDLKASFFDELVARGMPESKVQEAIEAAFLSAGTDVFTAIVAKATELMYKSEESYKDLKATIQSAGIIHGKPTLTEDDLEKREVKEKLIAGSIPLSFAGSSGGLNTPFTLRSVQKFRDRISFKRTA